MTQWGVWLVVFYRNHPVSGRVRCTYEIKAPSLYHSSTIKSYFAMATIFFFFGISTTWGWGLIPLNQFAISHFFECWSTHSCVFKSSHSVCPFRCSAAASIWHSQSHFSMARWQYTESISINATKLLFTAKFTPPALMSLFLFYRYELQYDYSKTWLNPDGFCCVFSATHAGS